MKRRKTKRRKKTRDGGRCRRGEESAKGRKRSDRWGEERDRRLHEAYE